MKLDRRELAAVFAGGVLGTLLRVGFGKAFASGDADWPWVVFLINISGALLLGYLVTRLQERLPLSTYRRQLMATGFCGAYTTFSTMQLELLNMWDARRYALAAAYLGSSVICGYVAVHVSTALTRGVRVGR
ncbi:MAG TPA: fluoride efflux transporter CrcB [Solirubrobacteraceae bacterium]|jgi:CrcB protein|nr:fluoride efflux transporter CrcB [Solirubrobacteraceae bacterium]